MILYLRSLLARRLVIVTSGWISTAYYFNCVGKGKLENGAGLVSRLFSHTLLPLAQKVEYETAVTQMVEECWWG
jgi:hypothetical protein